MPKDYLFFGRAGQASASVFCRFVKKLLDANEIV